MVLQKRYCVEYFDGSIQCFRDDGFWNTNYLISYSERQRHGQVPQNHFTFYAQQPPYQQQQQGGTGAYGEPLPMYYGSNVPPQYFTPAGASKMEANQGMEMRAYAVPPAAAAAGPAAAGQANGGQESGVVRSGNEGGDVEQQLPPRPQQAKEKLRGIVGRFRR
ncbi:hypothetical protein ACEQ8H_006822 [Pleosporales sp. CAS-2024a]